MSSRNRRRRWRRPTVLAASAVLAVSSLTGCAALKGSSAGDDETVIKLRAVAAEGSGLTNYPDVQVAARAAAKAINAAGGVNGRKIDLTFCNTRGDANQAMVCARDAYEDHVDAIVGRVDIFSTQSTPVYEKAEIPDIGPLPAGAATDYTSEIAYPLQTGNYGAFTSAPYAFKAGGYKRMVTVALDFPATLNQAATVEKAAKVAGMPTAGVIKIPSQGVTDYSPYAQQIKERGADSALILLGPAGLQAMYKAVAATGVKAQFAGTVFSFGESEARAIGSASDGIWVTSPFPSLHDTANRGIRAYTAELDAAGVKQDPELRRAAGLNAWLAVHAAADVAATIKGDVTAKSMTEALGRTRDLNVEGLVTWSPADLGKDPGSAFPRFPSSSSFRVLTFKHGQLLPSDIAPLSNTLKGVR